MHHSLAHHTGLRESMHDLRELVYMYLSNYIICFGSKILLYLIYQNDITSSLNAQICDMPIWIKHLTGSLKPTNFTKLQFDCHCIIVVCLTQGLRIFNKKKYNCNRCPTKSFYFTIYRSDCYYALKRSLAVQSHFEFDGDGRS